MANLKDFDTHDFEVRKGVYWLGLTFEYPTTYDIDLTGANIRAYFKAQANGKIFIMNTTDNVPLIEILTTKSFAFKQQIINIDAGIYDYDIKIDCVTGAKDDQPKVPIKGTMTVINTISI